MYHKFAPKLSTCEWELSNFLSSLLLPSAGKCEVVATAGKKKLRFHDTPLNLTLNTNYK